MQSKALNRLDRITSGLMLISKNSQQADKMAQEMRHGDIKKEYLCRVTGEFPSTPIVCSEPIKTLGYTVNLNYVDQEGGKSCSTLFERLSYNGRTSLVRCQPLTGRTHQIRVHLRYLGYPIANDPMYGYATAWSDPLSQGQIQDVIQSMIENAPYDYMDDDPLVVASAVGGGVVPRCQVCRVPLPPSDPVPAQLALWLHAYKYSGKHWTFQTPDLPLWAHDSFQEDHHIIPASF